MSEITKLYENAIGKVCTHTIINPERCNKRRMTRCCGCNYYAYPPFTAEKQIELIKWLARKEMLCRLEDEYSYFERFEECIAYIINYLWQDLTEEEKQQVKGILE